MKSAPTLSRARSDATPRFRFRQVALACSAVAWGAAHAQTAPAEPRPARAVAVETVTVTGIRSSLESALNMKRNASGVVDGIVAEDIGKFPDTNLAEAMQRISGVSIDRSIGEGSRVTVRGISPDFNLVLLNGRQMPASSIADTTASNSRAFDFANLAAESVTALEVFKTSRASAPAGGLGAVINIKTVKPLDLKRGLLSLGVKAVHDRSNERLPEDLQGRAVTPEVSGIYSTTLGDGRFGIALAASYQERDLGYNQAATSSGWRTFRGDENNWGTIPQPGTPGAQNIVNRPGPNDIYTVPQNVLYSVNGLQRQRTNGQLTLQYRPVQDLTATLDYHYSENKIQTKRHELSAWFNFGPSVSSWTPGPVSAPLYYEETLNGTADLGMGGGRFATKNENHSTGINLAWKLNERLSFEFDAHRSSAESGADSPYGSNSVMGAYSHNRGTTRVDYSRDLPVLSIQGTRIDASRMLVTGSSFRNSYMKSEVDQGQLHGKLLLGEESQLDFGLSLNKVKNRTAFANVQRDSWGGVGTPANYDDGSFKADTLGKYFTRVAGHDDPALFNQFFTFDFERVRAEAAALPGSQGLYAASSDFTTDRRTQEESKSLYLQFSTEWSWGVPMRGVLGVRHERTEVTAGAVSPAALGISWGAANELTLQYGPRVVTQQTGSYSFTLPSLDITAELRKDTLLRASYGESIGRPTWERIQGGVSLDQLVRFDGGTGSQGNPGLKPLKSKNFDLSLEHYYARGSYAAINFFEKRVSNYSGNRIVRSTPYNLATPIGGALYNAALASGGCVGTDPVCLRNYILRNFNGTSGVVRGADDAQGNATGTIPGVAGNPIASFGIVTPANLDRTERIHGLELNVQHGFGNSGFGVGVNYTKVKSSLSYNNASRGEQFALEGISDSANFVAFYEDAKYSLRVAYNWRDKFLTSGIDGGGHYNPLYVEAYGQVDLSAGWKLNDRFSFQFEVINLNDGIQRLHSRNKEQLIAVTQTGSRYMLGARYQF